MTDMASKEDILGQFFTKKEIVRKLIKLILKYKSYDKSIRILEPSSGTGNFVAVLKDLGFQHIVECEIDKELTKSPCDFFNFPLAEKYSLIVGNPPFTKYNITGSYYFRKSYADSDCKPESYLTLKMLKKEKERIENAFIMKSLKHLKDKGSSIGFVLPISFFIKNRNREVKEALCKRFSTIVIYQNDKIWFNYEIPCCFALFTNSPKHEEQIILIFEDSKDGTDTDILSKGRIFDEIIPRIHFNKKNGIVKNHIGTPLSEFISDRKIRYKKSYTDNNVSGKNILQRQTIPSVSVVENYKLAIVRVGNSSVGRCGLIDVQNDILNDMFYVLGFKDRFDKDKALKERICFEINRKPDYFRNITCRVGSKSIKMGDVLDFRVKV